MTTQGSSLHDCPHRRRPRIAAVARRCVVALCVSLACGLATAPSSGAAAPARATVEVSFDPGAFVRLRGQRFVALSGADAGPLNDAVARRPVVRIERLVARSEADVDATRRGLLRAGNRDVPDLNRHYRIVARDGAARDDLLAALRRLAIVDEAIAEPEPAPAPVTPSFAAQQRYGTAAPAGIGAASLAGRPGGLGQAAKIVDVEYSWNTAHEDLEHAAGGLIANGTPSDPFPSDNKNHGTAVLGVLTGTDNGLGVSGLAAGSAIAMVNAYSTAGYTLANALDLARQNLTAGDVMLVEQQTLGVQGTNDYVPVEYLPAAYDAIRLATQAGITVVEAAGNGNVDLDGAAYGSPFPAGKPDSGAIVVGAGGGDATCSGSPANARIPSSTFGSRVNVQGWGGCVVTTGYGTLFNGGPNALYTQTFNGTSSASATVAAAAALYSSVVESETGAPPSPRNVRSRLIATGTPQGGSGGHIGPLPDLAAATTGYDGTPPTVTLGGPPPATNDTTPTFTFTASETGATFECRLAGETAFSGCSSPLTLAPLSDGTRTLEVRATDMAFNTGPAAPRTFTIDTVAPAVALDSGPPSLTNDATPTFAFSSNEAGATFACRTGTAAAPGAFAPCSSPHTTSPLPDGELVFEVRATDAAANTGGSATRSFALDTVAPAVSIVDGPADPTSDATPTFAFSSDDPGASIACRTGTALEPGTFAPCTSPYTAPALTDGAHVFEVRATDAAANAGGASRSFTVDTRPPAPPPTTGSDAPLLSAAVSPPAPPPAALVVPAVPAAPPTIGAGTRLTVRVAADGTVRLARPRIGCPNAPPACTVSATARRGSAQIASARTTIAPGSSVTLRFKLNRRARLALTRSHRFAGTVRITARHAGASASRTLRVTFTR
ncbi:MAG: hypothetical protein QOJ35_1638 [Solirubrobacteraceae bacterium]|nr:hypothetical protein [Solirubrobacteraceae bacterium]